MARHSKVGQGEAWHGGARRGSAVQGTVLHGGAWQSAARQGLIEDEIMVKQKNPAPRRGSPNVKRDAEIYRLVVIEGRTLAAVGAIFGISAERTRQVASKQGKPKHGALMPVRVLRRVVRGQCIRCGIHKRWHSGHHLACHTFLSRNYYLSCVAYPPLTSDEILALAS